MRNQIAQIAVRWPVDESLLGHPEVVVHFREILVAGVGDQTDDTFGFRLFPAITQRAGDSVPVDEAPKIPSLRKSSRAVAKLSSSSIPNASVTNDMFAVSGMKF